MKKGIDKFKKALKCNIIDLLDSLPMGILVLEKGNILFYNPAACQALGIDLIQFPEGDVEDILKRHIEGLLKREFIHQPGKIYKVMRFPRGERTVCFILEITSLEYIDQFFLSVDFAEEILKYMFLNPYEGLNVVDRNGIILYMSPTHEKFFNIEHGKAIGKHVTEIIENTRLHIVAKTGKAEIGKTQEMMGVERIVARIPIRKNGRTIGAIGKVMFRDLYQLKEITQKLETLRQQVDYYKSELRTLRNASFSLEKLIGKAPCFEHMKEQIRKAAHVDFPVFIMGESGTGKELVAHTIHNLSSRARNPMVTVNCAAIPPELFESELFGYEPGSFTNADRRGKIGKFELANGSSIFLDEIGDLPLEMQCKLMRVLQEGYLEKIGSKKPVKSDFRVISATNKDIGSLLAQNRFRLDLFYRINAITIIIPPLRERKEDIPLLIDHFINEFNRKYNSHIKGVTEEVIQAFHAYKWPGNVRELQNEIRRACSFASGDVITIHDLSPIFMKNIKKGDIGLKSVIPRKEVLINTERELILDALNKTEGNKRQASKLLGISRTMLYKKIKAFNISIKTSNIR